MPAMDGYIYGPDGIGLRAAKQIKEMNRPRISEYIYRPNAKYTGGRRAILTVNYDIARSSAKLLIKNGCYAVSVDASALEMCQNSADRILMHFASCN